VTRHAWCALAALLLTAAGATPALAQVRWDRNYYHAYHPYYNYYHNRYHNFYYHPYYYPYLYPYTTPLYVPGTAPIYVPNAVSNPEVTDYAAAGWSAPASGYWATPDPALQNAAAVHVVVPNATAVVLVNGQQTLSEGNTRLFQTPPLVPGQQYYYEVTMMWNQNGEPLRETRTVPVAAGQSVVVDFTRPATTAALP
jgi:uncharacterized protein (TIGR03000 family)